jgi:hypothetical protein
VLCADFEEGAAGTAPSANHPILGATPIGTGTWHHVAATYDGATWKLYLDGNQDAQLAINQPVAAASDVPLAIASALNSTAVASGFFDGVMDEVRIWNFARTQAEIQSTINSAITVPTSGLMARWALDEGAGTAVNGSAGTTVNGTITGAGYAWASGAPFDIAFTPPAAPSEFGADAPSNVQINLTWGDNSGNESGFEIERSTTGIGGVYSLLTTRPANSTSYSDLGLSTATEYCYRIRAVNGSGASAYDGPACATTLAAPSFALDFSGSTYVTFGARPGAVHGGVLVPPGRHRDHRLHRGEWSAERHPAGHQGDVRGRWQQRGHEFLRRDRRRDRLSDGRPGGRGGRDDAGAEPPGDRHDHDRQRRVAPRRGHL